MSQAHFSRFLIDTRPFPADPVKNDLLLHATQIATGTSGAQKTLASESLQASIYQMLQQNHYLGLSVAMSMAPNPAVYKALFSSLDETLMAKTDAEIQWFTMPVVLVVGSKVEATLNNSVPSQAILDVAKKFPHLKAWENLTILPHFVDADAFTKIKSDTWFAAKQNLQAAQDFANSLPDSPLNIEAGQEVKVIYALAYGNKNDASLANQPLQDAALHLMQVWQEHFNTGSQTIFTNPLPLATPLAGLLDGSHTRMRMAADVFATNAIRAIRLQNPRVGVVIASQEGGRLLFGFNATETAFQVQPQVFVWQMDFSENIEAILQNFIELLIECQVENIRILHDPLSESDVLPTYAQARNLPSINPLFAEMQ